MARVRDKGRKIEIKTESFLELTENVLDSVRTFLKFGNLLKFVHKNAATYAFGVKTLCFFTMSPTHVENVHL